MYVLPVSFRDAMCMKKKIICSHNTSSFCFKELILYARHMRTMSNISPILQPKLNLFFVLNNFDRFDSLLTFISNLYQEIVI